MDLGPKVVSDCTAPAFLPLPLFLHVLVKWHLSLQLPVRPQLARAQGPLGGGEKAGSLPHGPLMTDSYALIGLPPLG